MFLYGLVKLGFKSKFAKNQICNYGLENTYILRTINIIWQSCH